jgi:hypothetical protein
MTLKVHIKQEEQGTDRSISWRRQSILINGRGYHILWDLIVNGNIQNNSNGT